MRLTETLTTLGLKRLGATEAAPNGRRVARGGEYLSGDWAEVAALCAPDMPHGYTRQRCEW